MKKGEELSCDFNDLWVVFHNKPILELDQHTHKEHQILIPICGSVSFSSGNKDYILKEKQMIFVPADHKHSFKSTSSNGERLIIYIKDKKWKKMGGNGNKIKVMPSSQLIIEIAFYIILGQEKKFVKSYIDSLIYSVIESMSLNRVPDLTATKNKNMQKAIRILKKNAFDKINFDTLSQECGMSRRNFSRVFKQEVGLSPKQFQIKIRINEAMILLETQKDMSITEISYHIGFDTPGQFIKAFKSHTGQIPSRWIFNSQA